MTNVPVQGSTQDEIRVVVERLARPHRSGGVVIERAAILAEGARSAAIVDWILERAGEPESAVAAAPSHGLHGARFGGVTTPRGPARYVLPPGALTPTP
jgi:hypothetical protein